MQKNNLPPTKIENPPKMSHSQNGQESRAQSNTPDYFDSKSSKFTERNTLNGSSGSRNNGKLGIIILVAVVAAITATAFSILSGKKDHVDAQTQKQWESNFLAAQPMKFKLVEASQVNAAIASMQMPVTEKQKLQKELDVGHARLVWVQLRDNCAEDGDIVRIDSGLFSQTVTIRNAGDRIPVPEPPSGVMNVVGIHDGGGGITVEMVSGNSPVNLPVMQVNQAVGVPIVPFP